MSEINLAYVKKIIPEFFDWLCTDEGKKFSLERDEKDSFVQFYLCPEAVERLDEGALRELISYLWSFEYWTNKDWLLDQMLHSGLPKIRKAFKVLLYSKKPLAERFDQMREIDRMGAATISEILAHLDHENYPIYNKRAKSSLIKLGVNPNSLPKVSQITGSQYEEYVKVVKLVYKQIHAFCKEINDLLAFDFLLYYISLLAEEEAEKPIVLADEGFDHASTIENILLLGDSLGFEVQKEYAVASGCRIDAIWRSRVANLGMITYAFEVQHKGSLDSAILNLQKILRLDPTVQKVVVIATDAELEKFRKEIDDLDPDFKKAVGYFSVQCLEEALAHQEELKRILALIGLMKTRTKTEPI